MDIKKAPLALIGACGAFALFEAGMVKAEGVGTRQAGKQANIDR
ncbi:hypothetical protein [Paenibacillus sp. FSL H8-0537]